MRTPLWPLFSTLVWQDIRRHRWRYGVAVLAVMLGVGLALAVHLINASALNEFSAAVRGVNGEPDAQLRSRTERLGDEWLERVRALPEVDVASPVLELQGWAVDANGTRVSVRLWGVDALSAPVIDPGLAMRLGPQADRLDLFAADAVFLNPAARAALSVDGGPLTVMLDGRATALRVAGDIGRSGSPLVAMDVAALQDLSGRLGELSRLDLRLAPGTAPDAVLTSLHALYAGSEPSHHTAALWIQQPGDDTARMSQVSRAYRVNLTVLALVALFTGTFLVFSVLSLSVTQRLPQFALLGVLGMDAADRQRLVWAESAALGAVGSAAGVVLGTALAWGALRWLGGDLGGGFFDGVAPALQWHPGPVLGYAALGVVAAGLGGWWPSRLVRGLAPAQALKGIPMQASHAGSWHGSRWTGVGLLGLAGVLALLPPIDGVAWAAYASIAACLVGGILTLPVLVHGLLGYVAARPWSGPLCMLAVERARRYPGSAAVATSGVVASLALSVALTVMVGSFRLSMTDWLDAVLPADLYVRSSAETPGMVLPAHHIAQVAAIPGVARVEGIRAQRLTLDARRPPVTVIARTLRGADGPFPLPLVGPRLPWPDDATQTAVFVSEAMVDLYGARLGEPLQLPGLGDGTTTWVVAGIWRDYGRPQGSVAIDSADYQRLTGDTDINDLAITLSPGVRADTVQRDVRALSDGTLDVTSSQTIRAVSLQIFDRSFAVTTWLQAVAIGMGLMGVSASFAAQIVARRTEFGLLRHLGLSRRQVLSLVAAEGALWTTLGALAGVVLGLLVSVVLVHVVNPQSFHWTMTLHVPWASTALLALTVIATGTATAWLSGQLAASQQAVMAVKDTL